MSSWNTLLKETSGNICVPAGHMAWSTVTILTRCLWRPCPLKSWSPVPTRWLVAWSTWHLERYCCVIYKKKSLQNVGWNSYIFLSVHSPTVYPQRLGSTQCTCNRGQCNEDSRLWSGPGRSSHRLLQEDYKCKQSVLQIVIFIIQKVNKWQVSIFISSSGPAACQMDGTWGFVWQDLHTSKWRVRWLMFSIPEYHQCSYLIEVQFLCCVLVLSVLLL